MNIHLVWAQDNNGGIGKSGNLPWHISEDLKNFKSITLNSTIIMGRKTWDSLPIKPLPKRNNIVLSSRVKSEVITFSSLDDCWSYLNKHCKNQKIFIIGGRSIYKLFFEKAQFLHITFIDLLVLGVNEFFPIDIKYIKKYFNKIEDRQLSNDAKYTLWKKIVK